MSGSDQNVAKGWNREVEIRFRVSAKTVANLLKKPPLVTGLDQGERHLHSSYFDTPDGLLRNSNLALRVRRTGNEYLQTIKTGDTAYSATARLEHDTPLIGPEPDCESLAYVLKQDIDRIDTQKLALQFETRINRRTFIINHVSGDRRATIEVALDRGTITARHKHENVNEIELELIDGETSDLFDLGLVLHQCEPVSLEPRTKSERGYCVAGGAPPQWYKARKIQLSPAATLDEVISRSLNACFDHWLVNQTCVLDGRDSRGLHQLRVALRRLRAVLEFFQVWLPEDEFSWFRREVRWTLRSLTGARDIDVLLDNAIRTVLVESGDDADVRLLAKVVERKRRRAYDQARRIIGSHRYTRAILFLGRWISRQGWQDSSGCLDERATAVTAHRLEDLYRSVVEHGAGFHQMNQADRHKLRIKIKHLRYGIQIMESSWGRADDYLSVLGKLQDSLGFANDTVVSNRLLRECMKSESGKQRLSRLNRACGLVEGRQLARKTQNEAESRALWREFLDLRPFWHTP